MNLFFNKNSYDLNNQRIIFVCDIKIQVTVGLALAISTFEGKIAKIAVRVVIIALAEVHVKDGVGRFEFRV